MMFNLFLLLLICGFFSHANAMEKEYNLRQRKPDQLAILRQITQSEDQNNISDEQEELDTIEQLERFTAERCAKKTQKWLSALKVRLTIAIPIIVMLLYVIKKQSDTIEDQTAIIKEQADSIAGFEQMLQNALGLWID